MASHDLIDAQFDRAVQIVQSLPKTGPIQTDYEEKLEMYRYDDRFLLRAQHFTHYEPSLYKQGNLKLDILQFIWRLFTLLPLPSHRRQRNEPSSRHFRHAWAC
jgi:hypothetical protein